MGVTAQYAIVTKQELDYLLTGDAQKFIDDLCEDRYGLRPRFAPTPDASQQDMAADPLALLEREKLQVTIEQAFSSVRNQKAVSQQRLASGDREEFLDEICKLYASGERRWELCEERFAEGNHFQGFKQFSGFTEDNLAREAMKRGYHLWLDLDKSWDSMHELLTGVTFRERRDEATLWNAMPFIELAKRNTAFPARCVANVEEARNTMRSMFKEVDRIWHVLDQKVQTLWCETDDCPDELTNSLNAIAEIRRMIAVASPALYTCLMNIAAIQKENDEAVFVTNRADLVAAEKCARSVLALSAETQRNIRSTVLGDAEAITARELLEQVIALKQHLTTKIRLSPWLSYFAQAPASGSTGDNDMLSMAVSGGSDVPGLTQRHASYVTVDQTRAIADLLQPLTSVALVEKHDLNEHIGKDEFDCFKNFYIRAAQFECSVLVFIG